MTLSIGGVDITPYIAFGGVKWSRNDVDGPNAGRTQSGDMERDRVAVKYRWDITCRPLTATELATIQALIEPDSFSVAYTDPMDNSVKTALYYSNNYSSTYLIRRSNGEELWGGLTFPLIQI